MFMFFLSSSMFLLLLAQTDIAGYSWCVSENKGMKGKKLALLKSNNFLDALMDKINFDENSIATKFEPIVVRFRCPL